MRPIFTPRLALLSLAVATALPASVLAEPLSQSASNQIHALLVEKESRNPARQKMDSQLIFALKRSLGQPIATGITNLQFLPVLDANSRLEVDLDATVTTNLLDFITQSGGAVINSFPQFDAIRANVPITLTETLAARGDVRFVRPADKAMLSTGSVTSEGDITENAAVGRQAFAVDGFGVKIGVISDSVDFLASSQATADCPPVVTVLPGQSGVPATGEGTAMLEIVHDLAPGADLFFATANGGPANFAQNILNLRAAGCDVIVDDVFYFNEACFQDGVVARAVNRVTAGGALYFSSAGNYGNKSHGTSSAWEGNFVDGGPAGAPVNGKNGEIHDFGGLTYDTILGFSGSVYLFWPDPLNASTNDYDLFILDSTGANILGASTTVQNGSQSPVEGLIGFVQPGERIVIVRASGDVRFLHLDAIGAPLQNSTTGWGRGHAAATNCFAVAAVDVASSYPNPFSGGGQNPVEDFSSDGPRRMFFQADGTPITPADFTATGGALRQFPTVAASDGVQTSLPAFNPFFGTSAAAPHAAAIAGLLKSYNPDLTPAQIRTALITTALDIEAPGLDINSGYGIVMAQQALASAPPPIPLPRLLIATNFIFGGNGNGIIDFDECNNLTIVLTNVGRADATGIRATLSTTTPGAIVASPPIDYPTIPVGGSSPGVVPFKISTGPDFVCGTIIQLNLLVKSDQTTSSNQFSLKSGQPAPLVRFDASTPVSIPDGSPAGTNSFLLVSNLTNAITSLKVILYINHTFDSDLTLQLISPDHTTNILSAHNGGSGDNYGLVCSPDNQRTIFDDAAVTPIISGSPPFVGSYQPQEPLSIFIGKSGTNVNGIWTLHVVDDVAFDVGTIQCWSLSIGSVVCQDGGGECPGADLALSMTAAPDPLVIGNPLTYSISVTNRGPSSAKNVVVTQLLPNGSIFVSAVPSQGGFSQSAGVLSCTFGTIPARGVATLTVTVLPSTTGVASSTATVSSSETDFDTSNNSVTISTHVNPPTAELAVGLSAAPDPAVLGGTLIYSVSVTNNGPSPATSVVVSNLLPAAIVVHSATVSQGSVTILNNVIICSFNNLAPGGVATASINVTPTTNGVLVATATASAAQLDPLVGNNTVSISTTVGPAADLAITLTNRPSQAVLGANVIYLITVTNRGPSPATGVVLSQVLPAGATLVSSNASLGGFSLAGNTLTWTNPGALAANAGVIISNVVTFGSSGAKISTVTASAAQADPNLSNNSAVVVAQVAPPFVNISASGAALTYESLAPTNGAVDFGETVTMILRLRNDGNVNNTNLTATLLATNGIVTTNGQTQAYGVLPPGAVLGRPFTFTASGTNGASLIATLQLHDVGGYNTNVTFTFTLPTVRAFSNSTAIAIRDQTSGLPYPSTLVVSGLTGTVGKVTATLVNASHTFPQDIDALLVNPSGQKTILMSGAGAPPLANANITFDDGAASVVPDGTAQIVTGSYRPATYLPALSLPAPAPANPYPAGLTAFNSADPNGTWSLYVADHAAGDTGSIAGGWNLIVTLISPVNQLADVGILASASPNPAIVGQNLTYTFTVTNNGPANATFVTFTNPLPAGVAFVSVVSSQGSVGFSGAGVAGSLGPLNAGAAASVTVVVTPLASVANPLTASATISSTNELDLNSVNNSAPIITPINFPVADVSLTLTSAPSPTVLGFTLTNNVVVTNNGPGMAFNVWLTNSLPPGVILVVGSSTPGAITSLPGKVLYAFGDLAANAATNVTVVLSPTTLQAMSNSLSVATSSSDPNLLNNLATTVVPVSNAVPVIVAAGSALIFESGPVDGGLENGETVTLSLSLRNDGYADATNFTATLLPGNGVTAPSAPQVYGALPRGGPSLAKAFTFIATGTNGAPVLVTLSLTNSSGSLGTVTFVYNLAGDHSFANSSTNAIPDHGAAAIYPSIINVSGLTGVVTKATVTLSNLSHSFPRDINVLLVSPAGGKVLLMSHAGGANALTNITLTFDDAATNALPQNDPITSGVRLPTAFGDPVVFPAPAPVAPFSPLLVGVNGGDPNGDWALFVFDDSAGDAGVLRGWSLRLTTVAAINPLADLAVAMSSSPSSLFVGAVFTNTITVTNLGPSTATGVYVTNIYPIDVTLVSPPGGGLIDLGSQGVTISLGNLAVGATANANVVLAPTKGGPVVTIARVSANVSDLNQFNNTVQTTTTAIAPAPAILSGSISNGQFFLTLSVQSNFSYVIQASTNVGASSWVSLSTNVPSAGGVIKYTDSNASNYLDRFYRAVRLIP